MTWTHFWDMSSGGGQKEKWHDIFIEAPEAEAKVIFYNRFGHNPERVTCTCCGPDYSIDSHEDLAQLTGFQRGCRSLDTPKDEKGLYMNDDPVIVAHLYLEKDEKPPKGYKVSKSNPVWGPYRTLREYVKEKQVLVIYAKDIKPKERVGEVPEQGYVWQD